MMDKLYLAAVTIFGIGWYIEQRMYVDGYKRSNAYNAKINNMT